MKKYHFGFKVLAFLLAACALVAGVCSGFLVIVSHQNGLYTASPEQLQENALKDAAWQIADMVLKRYTAMALGNCTPNQLTYANRNYTNDELSQRLSVIPGSWDYRIEDLDGTIVETTYSGKISGDIRTFSFQLSAQYPVHADKDESEWIESHSNWEYRDYYYTETEEHFLYYYTSPYYVVTVRIEPGAAEFFRNVFLDWGEQIYNARYQAIGVLIASALVLILCLVYLGFAAGRSHRHDEIRLKGLTRLPLDLYGAAAGVVCALLLIICDEILDYVWGTEHTLYTLAFAGVCSLLGAACIIGLAYLYALMAQIKMKGGCWWRKSLIGWCLRKLWKGIKFCFRAVRKLFYLLPLIWQWLLTALAMILLPMVLPFFDALWYGFGFHSFIYVLWFLFTGALNICIICYGAYAFGTLLKGAKHMRDGDLNTKIPTRFLFGAFRDFAEQINTLADTAMEAARNQMKSERMKTELITNVSHDIKTPLTSLINYVDLLEKPHTEEEGQQYLEVLSRQSQRLKKLIDDLMDMSKASSGAMNVDITQVDAVEVLNQALGEFADKLEAQNLTTVFCPPAEPVMACCDGRLTWRVMSNLLSNIVKYALPGTRVYIDLTQTNGVISVSFKNISREPLNVSAEELTERFVRGDASRNTEGSGLGLNIAQCLMQLQQGDLQLFVDGDLFKVTLTFPAAE